MLKVNFVILCRIILYGGFIVDLFNDTLSMILTKQMDACTLRQRVIADNVANINTPGFKKSSVNFQQQLKEALDSSDITGRTTEQASISTLEPQVVKVRDTAMKAGKNNVDIDQEMVDLAANTLLYRLATRVQSDRANMLSYVIKGGR